MGLFSLIRDAFSRKPAPAPTPVAAATFNDRVRERVMRDPVVRQAMLAPPRRPASATVTLQAPRPVRATPARVDSLDSPDFFSQAAITPSWSSEPSHSSTQHHHVDTSSSHHSSYDSGSSHCSSHDSGSSFDSGSCSSGSFGD